MIFGRCLEALKHNQAANAAGGGGAGIKGGTAGAAGPKIIPFRESKITHLFRDVLHGWGNLVSKRWRP